VFAEERGIRHIAVVQEASTMKLESVFQPRVSRVCPPVDSHRRAVGAVVDIHNPREEEEAVDNLHNLAAEDCLEVRRSS
jgi:hypothetical protein